MPIWLLAVLFCVAELLLVHIAVGPDTHTFSLREVPLMLGAFLALPEDVLLGQLLGAGIALVFIRRQSAVKVVFNLATFTFTAALALLAFYALVDPADPLGPRGWVAAFFAVLLADIASAACVELVIHAHSGEPMVWRRRTLAGLAFTFGNATLALATVIIVVMRPDASWVAALVAAALWFSYRMSVREREQREMLVALQSTTNDIHASLGNPELEAAVVRGARDVFGASSAELWLPTADAGTVQHVCIDRDGVVSSQACADLGDPPGSAEAPGNDPGLPPGIEGQVGHDPAVHGHAKPQSMSAPVRVGDETAGTLTVIGREASAGGWQGDSLPVLETLASHVAVSLRNAQLLHVVEARAAENEYLARHDPLTGLPNRDRMCELIDGALRDHGSRPAAILAIDIDGFAELTETLGHENADVVLDAVALRVVAAAGEQWLVGRLDGHELAVVVPEPTTVRQVLEAATRIAAELETPFVLDDLALGVTPTIGIAHVAAHDQDARALMRCANRAVMLAKAEGSQIAEYAAAQDAHSPARLALVGDLRRALDSDELTVFYQAKVAIPDGRTVGAEALIRWLHPKRGMIQPDEFMGVAERSNVLRPITMLVLQTALARCSAWRARGHDLDVSVNLSARNLVDARLVDDVNEQIRRSGLSADALTLEITEGAAIADPMRAKAVMAELRSLGVRLSIDDFGAGFASLSYLKLLPASELKIDRTFVHNLVDDAKDRAIVRSTIELAHDLGFVVVAEGVETRSTLEVLGDLGCDYAQGWHLGRASAAHDFEGALPSH